MATNFAPKPFHFNINDLNFIRDQINFRPLFDAAGNAIVAWDGIGQIFKTSSGAAAAGNEYDTSGLTPTEAMAAYGTSYASETAAQGLRNVSGIDNNLFLTNHLWGSVDQPFLRNSTADFSNYLQPTTDGFYGSKSFGSSTSGNTDYAKSGDNPNTPADETAADRTVIDYTPRMISQTITTGGAKPLLDGNGQVVYWDPVQFANDPIYADLFTASGVPTTGLIAGAAVMAIAGILGAGQHDPQDQTNGETFFGAINPGVAPGNSFLAYFGQFFDHGLDFVGKGASGTKIYIPLALDDPLYRAPGTNGPSDPGNTRMVVSRADVSGFDANGNAEWINHTSPYIDQSQTYGSNAQLTTLLRAWVSNDGGATYHAGAHLFDGATSQSWTNAWGETTTATLPTLNELRAHLVATGRDDLTWADVLDLRSRDASGNVIDTDLLTDGVQAIKTGQALLLDMNPHFDTSHFSAATIQALTDIGILADGDGNYGLYGPGSLGTIIDFRTFEPMSTNASQALNDLAFDVLLESVGDHYIAGDGRANENVGLTAIHHVFHEEHNFQVRNIQEAIQAQDLRAVELGDDSHTIAHDWQVDAGHGMDANGNYLTVEADQIPVAATDPTYYQYISWNESKLFDAAKLTVEMEYQHAAVDQYARTVTPDIPEFVGYNSGENATVSLEYAQGAFRFGHSTMRETIDFLDPNGSITGKVMNVALEQAFLNPALFSQKGAAAIAMGLTHQQMNEVDELLTPAMNQGLLGQPLDLAAINIARGRDIGLPTLNDFREGVGLTRYTSWADFGAHMVHPESLVNFIAAYSFDGDVLKASAIVGLENGTIAEGSPEAMSFTVDQAIDFLNGSDTGFNHIDTWLGGLAEVHVMGGLLGETFNLVFVDQIQRLMDGDRFYYLYRLNNLNLGDEIANAQLKDIVERNTGLEHLNGSIFAYADEYVDLSAKVDTVNTTDSGDFRHDHKYGQILEDRAIAGAAAIGIYTTNGISTVSNGSVVTVNGVQYIRDIRAEGANGNANVNGENLDGTPDTGANANEVLIGTDNKDLIYMWAGDDTAYGEGGDDTIYGDAGIDRLYGGNGNDTIYGGDSGDLIDGGAGDDKLYGESSGTAAAGLDQIIGGDGNDIIYGGIGIDKLSGGAGDDVIYGGGDTDAFTHGGDGNDYIDGGSDGDLLWGDGGDDLIVGGDNQDIVAGLDGDDILRPGNPSSAMGGGPDEVLGGDGASDAGNDGKGVGFDLIDFSDYVASVRGVTADFATQQNPLVAIDGTTPFPAWVGIEGVIGSRNNDTVLADAGNNWLFGGSGNDVLTGGAGFDVIVGDGIRLDSLIGTYANPYTQEFDGATHRTRGFIQNNGLVDQAGLGFEKHFTEMLKSEIFRDLELGGSTVRTLIGGGTTGDGGTIGTDTVSLTGNRADYIVEKIIFTPANQAQITAYKITDTVGNRDASDLVVGVENFKFADGTLTAAQLPNLPPVITSNGGGATASRAVAENTTAVTTVTASDANNTVGDPLNPQALVFSISGGVDAAKFSINASTGVLNFLTAANFEAATDSGANNVYDVVIKVSDGIAFDTQALAVSVQNVNEARTGELHISNFAIASNAATLIATNSIADPDVPALTPGYQWQRLVGNNWVNIAGATGASLAGQVNTAVRVTSTYTDPFGTVTTVSGETAIVTGSNNNNNKTGTAGNDFVLGLSGNDTLNGGGGADVVAGGDGNDDMSGGSGNDILRDGNGQDDLNGDQDNDIFILTSDNTRDNVNGGSGFDNVSYASFTANLSVTLNGNNTVTVTGSGNGNNADRLQSIENITGGSGNDTLTGDTNNNTLSGGFGNDVLTGAAGNDILNGDDGNDTITQSGANGGRDIVNGGLGGTDTFVVNGNGADEVYRVYARAAAITAGITGLNANSDIVITRNTNGVGGAVTNANVMAELDEIEEIVINTGNGTDTILTIGDFTPTNLLQNTIRVNGSTSNETVDVSGMTSTHRVVFTSNGGVDTVIGKRAQDVVNMNTTLNGTSGNDVLVTGVGNDTLNGGDGHDTLNAGAGIDTMTGGLGNDTYYVDNLSDVVIDRVGQGTLDTILSTVNIRLDTTTTAQGIENVVLQGAGHVSVVGNAANNVITGNSGNNSLSGLAGNDVINGGAGNDRIIGGTGNDTMTGGTGSDTFAFASGFGNDRIADFDAAPTGGQDFIDLSAFGITQASFAAHVGIFDLGADTLIVVNDFNQRILLAGINDATTITRSDFMLFAG